MSNTDSNSVKPYLTVYPVTRVFTDDFLGVEFKNKSEFSIEFSHNISMRSLTLFSEKIDEIFS